MSDEKKPDWKCACPRLDAVECVQVRYGRIDRSNWDDFEDGCECACHYDDANEDRDPDCYEAIVLEARKK